MNEILEILQKDCNQSPEMIAAQVGMTPAEVSQKIKAWEEQGVIVRYKAVVNDEMAENGSWIRALIEVRVRPQEGKGFEGIAEKIYRFPEVASCMLLSGGYDLLLEVEGESIHTISKFVSEKLALIENVQSTVTHFILKKYKVGGDIFSPPDQDKRLAVSP